MNLPAAQATLTRLADELLALCYGHGDGECPCALCKAHAALVEATYRVEQAKGDRRWAVRWWRWDRGMWELVEERNYTRAEADRRAEGLNRNAGEDDPRGEAFDQEEFDHDPLCEVQRNGLGHLAGAAAQLAVPDVLRHGTGAVRLPAGA